jgi:acetylornithine deacetylase/succinyl-diaminopimelate desuccinylase-like protein
VTVRVLASGLHSGMASGIVPSSFRVFRALLDRLEDSATGRVLLPQMHVQIPAERVAEARASVETAPGAVRAAFPNRSCELVDDDELELMLNSSWRPTLSVTGAGGFPLPADSGNVLRPYSTLMLSFRLPPTADSAAALEALRTALTTDVPYGATVEIGHTDAADGWDAPALAPWLKSTMDTVAGEVFGNPWRTVGVGGSIPFMAMLAKTYPDAQFVVTGAAGRDSNAHVPDEWLNIDQAARVTHAVALILDAHATRVGA